MSERHPNTGVLRGVGGETPNSSERQAKKRWVTEKAHMEKRPVQLNVTER